MTAVSTKGTDMANFWDDPQLNVAMLWQLPYPLSWLLQSFLRSKATPESDQEVVPAFLTLQTIVGLARFSACVLLAEYIANSLPEQASAAGKHNRHLLNMLENPGDGTWVSILEYLTKLLSTSGATAMSEELCLSLTEPVAADDSPPLLAVLRQSITIRNQLVHPSGNTISLHQAAPILESYLSELQPLWTLFSGYALLVAGQQDEIICQGFPPFLRQRTAAIQLAPTPGHTWLQAPASLPRLLLTPLVYAKNIESSQPLVFFYNRHRQDRFHYFAYHRGGHCHADDIAPELERSCQALFTRLQQNAYPQASKSGDDIYDFDYLCAFHTPNFVGREDILAAITAFIEQSGSGYGLITGVAGIGKTALLAVLYRHNRQLPLAQQYLWHFCAHSDERDNPQYFLRSLLAQGYRKFPQLRQPLTYVLSQLRWQLQQFLQGASEQLPPGEKLVLVIDALDESLKAQGQGLTIPDIIPSRLPPAVVTILSARKDLLPLLPMARLTPQPLAVIDKLRQSDIATLLIDKIGVEHCQVNAEIIERIWQNSDGGDPLYLRFLADALRSGAVALRDIQMLPVGLCDFFQQLWLQLSESDDFLAHRILGLLAIMPAPGHDALLAAILDHPEAKILQARLGLAKLLIGRQDQYYLFHQRFRDFVLTKFRSEEHGDFHGMLARYYDAIDGRGQRQYRRLSDDAWRYLSYHAYWHGRLGGDYRQLYHLLQDERFMNAKQQQLSATTFVLSDWQYGFSAALAEIVDDADKLIDAIDYSRRYRQLISSGRQGLPERIAGYLGEKSYQPALYEIMLLAEEEERFYQLLLLATVAARDQNYSKAEEICVEAARLPQPAITGGNLPIYALWLEQALVHAIPGALELLPQPIPEQLWLEMWPLLIATAHIATIEARLPQRECCLGMDAAQVARLVCHIGQAGHPDQEGVWRLQHYLWQRIQPPYPGGKAGLALLPECPQAQRLELWQEILYQAAAISATQQQVEILHSLISYLPKLSQPPLVKVVDIIAEIGDEAARFFLAGELLCHCPDNDAIVATLASWLEATASPLKKSKLQPLLLAASANKRAIEELWLDLDQMIAERGSADDPKEVRALVDLARALVLIPDVEVCQELGKRLQQEIYSIGNELLRQEVMLAVVPALARAGLPVPAGELWQQSLYIVAAIRSWEHRAAVLAELAGQLVLLPTGQERGHNCRLLLQNLDLFAYGRPRQHAVAEVFANLPVADPSVVEAVGEYLQNLPHSGLSLALIRAGAAWSRKQPGDKACHTALLALTLLTRQLSSKTARLQALSYIGWCYHLRGDSDKGMELLYQGQWQYLATPLQQIMLPQTLFICQQQALSVADTVSAGRIADYFSGRIKPDSDWRQLLYYSAIPGYRNQEQSRKYLEAALNQISEINHSDRFAALNLWLEQIATLSQPELYSALLPACYSLAADISDNRQRSLLLKKCAVLVVGVENKRKRRQLLSQLHEAAITLFVDPLYRYRTVANICYQFYQKFPEDVAAYIEAIWHQAESTEEPILLAGLLRALRPFGPVRRVKQHMETVARTAETVTDAYARTLVIKDMLWSLNGIAEVSKLQRLLGKLLQLIEHNLAAVEQQQRLVDITERLSLLADPGRMEQSWDYLPRLRHLALSITDPYHRLVALAQMAAAVIRQQQAVAGEELLQDAEQQLALLNAEPQKSLALSQLALLYHLARNYERCLESLNQIASFQERMRTIQQIAAAADFTFLGSLAPLALADADTLDTLLARIVATVLSQQPDLLPRIIATITDAHS